MQNINYFKIDDLRNEIILCKKELENNPLYYQNKNVKNLFSSLLSVKTKQNLKDWIEESEKYDEGKKTLGNGTVREENILANIVYKAKSMTEEEVAYSLSDIIKLSKLDFNIDLDKNLKLLQEEKRKTEKSNPNSILLFRKGNDYFAIENDADKIFEEKGWQSTVAETQTKKFSWIIINEAGKNVLEKDNNIIITNAKTEVRDFIFKNESYSENIISNVQQNLDFLRDINTHEYVSLGTEGAKYYNMVENCYEVEKKLDSIWIEKEKVDVIESDGTVRNLMDRGLWNISKENTFAFHVLQEYWDAHSKEMKESIWGYEHIKESRKHIAHSVLQDFNSNKTERKITFLKSKDYYYCFGDDAILIAKELKNVPLWQIETVRGKTLPVVVVSAKGYSLDILDAKGIKYDVKKARVEFDKNSIGLELSPLNKGLKESEHFEKASVFKMKNGDYAVRATLQGQQLEIKPISTKEALHYNSLPYGEEKKLTLKTILVNTYKDNLMANKTIKQDFNIQGIV